MLYSYVKWSLEGENTAGLEVFPLVKALPPRVPCPGPYTNEAQKLGEDLSRGVLKRSPLETGHEMDARDHVNGSSTQRSMTDSPAGADS